MTVFEGVEGEKAMVDSDDQVYEVNCGIRFGSKFDGKAFIFLHDLPAIADLTEEIAALIFAFQKPSRLEAVVGRLAALYDQGRLVDAFTHLRRIGVLHPPMKEQLVSHVVSALRDIDVGDLGGARILTFNNRQDHRFFRVFRESCRRSGVPDAHVIALGRDVTWRGYLTKVICYTAALERLPDDMVVVVIDSDDVILRRPFHDFVDVYEAAGAPIVVSAEMFFKDEEMNMEGWLREKRGTSFRKRGKLHLNGGCVAGKAKDLRRCWAAMQANFRECGDDQTSLVREMRKEPSVYDIDTECRLFLNLQHPRDLVPGCTAFFYHYPGMGLLPTVHAAYEASAESLVPGGEKPVNRDQVGRGAFLAKHWIPVLYMTSPFYSPPWGGPGTFLASRIREAAFRGLFWWETRKAARVPGAKGGSK